MKKLGVIVPYRDREEHLKIFAPYIKKFLRYKQIPNFLIIVEQVDDKSFNRAKLLNIGYEYAQDTCDYFVFHDIDLIPEKNTDYSWVDRPTHLSHYCSQFNYKLPYDRLFGGVSMFNKEDFIKVNGFSNTFWGWGAEDDEIRARCDREGLIVDRRPGRYTSLPHNKAKVTYEEVNRNGKEWRKVLNNRDNGEYKNNGINSLKYELIDIEKNEHYYLLKVKL
tara:strand:+ start:3544 stop:4206 length:663 start_codon:yes stop_codon:yes gene_type:complete